MTHLLMDAIAKVFRAVVDSAVPAIVQNLLEEEVKNEGTDSFEPTGGVEDSEVSSVAPGSGFLVAPRPTLDTEKSGIVAESRDIPVRCSCA
jgi:hypothetical protein